MNPELFASNMGVIQSRWPWLAEQILAAEGVRDAVLDGQTLVINGIHLTSVVDRLAEAKSVADTVPAYAREVTVYGFALGDTVEELLNRGLPKVRVRVMSPSVFGLVAGLRAMPWLSDERLEFVDLMGVRYPFVVAPGSLTNCDPVSYAVRDAVMAALAKPFVDRKMESARAAGARNLSLNRETAKRDGNAVGWLREQKWLNVWVAGAGPTLFEGLKGWNPSRGKLIAVGRAVKALVARGIRPDVAVTVDVSEVIAEQFRDLQASDVGECVLIYTVSSDPAVVDMWPGRRLATLLEAEAHCHLGPDWPFGRLFCGGSVVHTAIDAGVIAGAENLYLAGVDLSFPDEWSHAVGAVNRAVTGSGNSSRIRVSNGCGGEVPTDVALAGFLRELEDYIVTKPSVRFFATSRRGARIRGTQFLEE